MEQRTRTWTQRNRVAASASMPHLQARFHACAVPTCNHRHIRDINADLGEGKPYGAIAEVIDRPELTQEENLATAALFEAAVDMRDAILAFFNPAIDKKIAEKMMRDAVGLDNVARN